MEQASPRREYSFRGGAVALFNSQAPEVLLSGPAGTGKSVACLAKLHFLCESVPRLRALIVRKTRESLTETALVTLEDRILPEGHPAKQAGGQRKMRQAYRYPNGSQITVGGMDKPSKIMSSEYDCAYVQEAIELNEADWEAITTRLRNGRLAYQQLLADTNPDAPTHWLKRRCDAGKVVLLESRHEDNPAMHAAGGWTPAGLAYLAKLDALSGPRKLRLRHGRWAQSEGVVYDGYDPQAHLIGRFEVPLDWPRYWSIDFGYTNPFVCQCWAQDPDGRLYRYREVYHTRRLVEDHARRLLRLLREEADGHARRLRQPAETVLAALRPRAIVCDHDAEDRATLERHLQMSTTPARKDIQPGIQAVQARLRPAGDGRPRLFLLRASLDARDSDLAEAKRPTCLEEELDCYVWDERRDLPVKENDHSCDAMRYVAYHLDSPGRLWEAPSTAAAAPRSLAPPAGEAPGRPPFQLGASLARRGGPPRPWGR